MIKSVIKKLLPGSIRKAIDRRNLEKQFRYAKDGLFTTHYCNFMNDTDFIKAYQAGKSTMSWGPHDIEWRVHVVLSFAKIAYQLDGDFVECGVNRGGLSRSIIEYLDFNKSQKCFYLLDTFEGFEFSLLQDSEKLKYTNSSHYNDTYEAVKNTFKPFPNVRIIKGAVPGTLPQVDTDKVAFLSIDMNCVEPEENALDFFWPRLVQGAIIVLDDFAYNGFEEQNIAHTKWAKEKGIDILALPTGQGIIIKSAV